MLRYIWNKYDEKSQYLSVMLSYIYTGNISSRAETRPSDSIPPHWSVAKFQIMRMLSCWYAVWLGKLSVWGVGYICALWYREGGSFTFFFCIFFTLCVARELHMTTLMWLVAPSHHHHHHHHHHQHDDDDDGGGGTQYLHPSNIMAIV